MMHSPFHLPSPVTVSPQKPGSPALYPRAFTAKRARAVAILIGALCIGGCGDEDAIHSYTISKEIPSAEPASADGHATHQRAVIAYDVPEGWENIRHEEGMRFATLLVKDGQEQFEVSIIPLGGGAGGVAANVQRWRLQLGLGQATQEELAKQITEMKGRDGTPGLIIDMTGPGPDGNTLGPQRILAAIFTQGGQSWFIKTMGNADFIGKYRDGFVKVCESVRFEGGRPDASGTVQSAERAMPTTAEPPHGSEPMTRLPDWKIPEGWQQEPRPRPFSVVSFVVRRDGEEAVLTVSPLSSEPQHLNNVNRWRGQLGLMPVENLDETSTPVTVSGGQGVMVDLEGQDRRTLGVILPHAGATWFFKLMGPPAVIAAEKGAFEAFIQSIHFVEDASGE
jgi:hypothetical protein